MTTTTQTVRIAGVRTRLVTKNGKVTTTKAPPLEWELQAAQVRRLRSLPQYRKQFLLAGDMNAGKRGARAQVQAKATGMEPGEADLRIYGANGRLLLIENKVGRAPLTASQKERHPLLAALGHPVTVLRAESEDEAADKAEVLVLGWLAEGAMEAANDNRRAKKSEAV